MNGNIQLAPLLINGQQLGGGSIQIASPDMAALDTQALAFSSASSAADNALFAQTVGQGFASLNGAVSPLIQGAVATSKALTQGGESNTLMSSLSSLVQSLISTNSATAQDALSVDQSMAQASIASSNSSAGGGGCFLTTAVCNIRGLPDDCEPLNALRALRDRLIVSESGRRIIEHYYRVAPIILRRIRALDRDTQSRLYTYIDAVVQVVVVVGASSPLLAAEIYARMVTRLERISGTRGMVDHG